MQVLYIFVAVVEMVDTADLKSAGLYCEGSSPFGGTREARESIWLVSRATAKWRNRCAQYLVRHFSPVIFLKGDLMFKFSRCDNE